MIVGSLNQVQVLGFLGQTPVLHHCFDWIRSRGGKFPEGVTEFEGSDLYVNVHDYATKARQDCRWESHRHTADLQLCISGGELIDWSPAQPVAGSDDYDSAKDFEFWPSDPAGWETIHMEPSRFAIFLPGELHRPVIQDSQNSGVRKLVFKIHSRFLPMEWTGTEN